MSLVTVPVMAVNDPVLWCKKFDFSLSCYLYVTSLHKMHALYRYSKLLILGFLLWN